MSITGTTTEKKHTKNDQGGKKRAKRKRCSRAGEKKMRRGEKMWLEHENHTRKRKKKKKRPYVYNTKRLHAKRKERERFWGVRKKKTTNA